MHMIHVDIMRGAATTAAKYSLGRDKPDVDSVLSLLTVACRLAILLLCTVAGTMKGALTCPFTLAPALAEAAVGDTVCLPAGLALMNLVPPTVKRASRCSSSTARTSLAE